MSRKAGRYTVEEVDALIEGYDELRHGRLKPWIWVRLIDLDRAFQRLDKKHRVAVLLCGIANISVRTAANLAGIPYKTMYNRYKEGVRRILFYLGGSK
ncbi:MAG: hypothetical protein QXQ02_03490 [Halobacteria archaeon]